MPEGPEVRPAPLRSRRDEIIQQLCDEFARDNLSLDEFERRLDIAHRAAAPAELDLLVADLKRPAPSAHPANLARPASTPAKLRESQTLIAVMGGVERKGRWSPARTTQVIAVMGGVELDFRDVELAEGVTELNILCCMGGVEIIVPPGVAVDTGGVAIMGAFANLNRGQAQEQPRGPVLRIDGFVLMGGVEIYVRRPGESAKEARRREREDQRLGRGTQ